MATRCSGGRAAHRVLCSRPQERQSFPYILARQQTAGTERKDRYVPAIKFQEAGDSRSSLAPSHSHLNASCCCDGVRLVPASHTHYLAIQHPGCFVVLFMLGVTTFREENNIRYSVYTRVTDATRDALWSSVLPRRQALWHKLLVPEPTFLTLVLRQWEFAPSRGENHD